MRDSGFLPAPDLWRTIAPTWNDTAGHSPGPPYRHRQLQGAARSPAAPPPPHPAAGRVSDGNSYALGGIAGHAGLFATAADVLAVGRALMWGTPRRLVNATTVGTFTTVHNLTQSARALGWDTNAPGVNTYRGCGNLSARTFTHTGYTGTQICNDPERQIVTVLLTNRVYPSADDASEVRIHRLRQRFNDAVAAAVPVRR